MSCIESSKVFWSGMSIFDLVVASLASSSAFSFPFIPTWLGIHASFTVMLSSFSCLLMYIKPLIAVVVGWVVKVVNVESAESESEYMMNFPCGVHCFRRM